MKGLIRTANPCITLPSPSIFNSPNLLLLYYSLIYHTISTLFLCSVYRIALYVTDRPLLQAHVLNVISDDDISRGGYGGWCLNRQWDEVGWEGQGGLKQ